MTRHEVRGGEIYHGPALDVLRALPAASASMAWVDGPYAMGIADWDRMAVQELADWYAPHVVELGRVLAPSASVYHWGSTESEAVVRDLYRAQGFRFRTLVVWNKSTAPVMKADPKVLRSWPDVTEVCGFYQRCAVGFEGSQFAVDAAIRRTGEHPIREWLVSEWADRGLTRVKADEVLGRNGMAGHYFGASQWELPTRPAFLQLAAYAKDVLGPHPDGRPAFAHPEVWREGQGAVDLGEVYTFLEARLAALRAEHDPVREAHEAARVPFTQPSGAITNVWPAPASGDVRDRLGHPCSKPRSFVERAIRASTRPGELVLDPFMGSGGVARVCAELPAYAARRHVSIDVDEAYVAAVVATVSRGQVSPRMF